MPDRVERLAASSTRLAQIPVGRLELVEVLAEVRRILLDGFAAADECSIQLVEAGRAELAVHGSAAVADLQHLQRELRQGPTRTAFESSIAVRSGSLGGDDRWPRFGPRAGRAGRHSVLASPLAVVSDLIGTVTLYGLGKDRFGSTDVESAVSVGGSAAVVLHNARSLEQSRRLAERLKWITTDGAAVQRAVGILMSRRGIDADAALATLQELSSRQNAKLTVVAEQIVDEAVRRARGRRFAN